VLSNKKVYICFLMALAMVAASPTRAAEVNPGGAASAPVVHKTQVVRPDLRTGKLVRSVVVSSRPVITKIAPAASAGGTDLNAIVEKAARAHEVDPLLVHSIIKVESNYNTHAVSNKGAQGLMQLTPSTARMLGVSNSFDPQQNIEAGVKYLKYLKDLYKDDRLALAAYNAGPGAVDKYKWIPPYAETENYVYQVGKRYGEARRAADAAKPVEVKAPEVKAVDVTPVEIKPSPVQTFIDENGRLHLRTTQ
jgi:soluble lytic murein transglycosylase-like protein